MRADTPFGSISEDDVNELERRAQQSLQILRPTLPPYPWADAFLTIGVTGTNGKTSTTHLVASILAAAGRPAVSESTLGYRLGDEALDVPRTTRGFLSAMQEAASRGLVHAVVEATSQSLAKGWARIWRFDFGVFTNLSRDHLGAHGSWEHYLASKAQLFVHLAPGRTAVLNAFDPASVVLDRVIPSDVRRTWYGASSRGERQHEVDLGASVVQVTAQGTRIELEPGALADKLGGHVELRMIGEVFAENALAAAAVSLAAGLAPEHVREGLAACPSLPGRFEVVHREPMIVIDFAHTPDALARVVATGRALAGKARVIVVFGAGGDRDREKRRPMGQAVGEQAEVAIVTNDNPRSEDPRTIAQEVAAGARKGGKAYVRVHLDRAEAIDMALSDARPGDVVLIAGKGHEQGQTIGKETLPFSDAEVVKRLVGR